MTLPPRRSYIDVARGVAVLLMIWAHTTDAWTRAAARKTSAFRDATIVGGFAAPLFLFLAGLALVLSATRAAEHTGRRAAGVDAICRRGLEIFILAFLFRVQSLIVSPGGPLVSLFRVDILNVMGLAIAVAGLLWGLGATTTARVAIYAAAATTAAMVTPIVRSAEWVTALPTWVQWYLRPAGESTTFTAFPWAGFVFAGGAVGALLASARDLSTERRLHLALSIVAVTLMAVGFVTAARPTIYTSSSYHTPSFWTSSPTWFAIRVGVMILALAATYAALKGCATSRVAQGFSPAIEAIARMGRASLFIYWIHVELVYGYASKPWIGRLPLWGTVIAFLALSALMYGAVRLRDYWPRRATFTSTSTGAAESLPLTAGRRSRNRSPTAN